MVRLLFLYTSLRRAMCTAVRGLQSQNHERSFDETIKPKVSAAQVLASKRIWESFTSNRGGKTRHQSSNELFSKIKKRKDGTSPQTSSSANRFSAAARAAAQVPGNMLTPFRFLFQCGGSAKYAGSWSSRDSKPTKRGRSTQCSGNTIVGRGGGRNSKASKAVE